MELETGVWERNDWTPGQARVQLYIAGTEGFTDQSKGPWCLIEPGQNTDEPELQTFHRNPIQNDHYTKVSQCYHVTVSPYHHVTK